MIESTGMILKALSGFYYVDDGSGKLISCRARGKFRHKRITPLVGDRVKFTHLPDGSGAARAMTLALADGGISPEQVGYINAHGTSTQLNDAGETAAVRLAFGAHAAKLAVSSTKSMTGHLLGAAGAVEAAFTALALREDFLPATIHYEQPDPACDLDVVPNTGRAARVEYAMSNSLGFGGHNASILLKKWED